MLYFTLPVIQHGDHAKIPHPGDVMSDQNPYPGDIHDSQIPVGCQEGTSNEAFLNI